MAHEYIHLVVAYRSKDNAPVWLQEGLATWKAIGKMVEPRVIGIISLLAQAVRLNNLFHFKFARSMAYLDSGDEAALASRKWRP